MIEIRKAKFLTVGKSHKAVPMYSELNRGNLKLQALVYDILLVEEVAGKRCSERGGNL